jgi:carbon storage regulator
MGAWSMAMGGAPMLVLTRKSNQSIMIGDDIEVSVLSVVGEKVRIGIQAPRAVPVYRREVYVEIQREQAAGVAAREAVAEPPII